MLRGFASQAFTPAAVARLEPRIRTITEFLPALLRRTAVIESTSPLSRETVRLSVGPSGVESVSPAGAVVSMVILDPDKADLKTPRRHVANVLPSRQLLRIPDRSGTVGRQAT
jgi:Alkylmercury lyase